jgi:hypothetical protein
MRGEGYDKAKSLYRKADKVISFMRHLTTNLVNALTEPQSDRDVRTLASFFPDHTPLPPNPALKQSPRLHHPTNTALDPPPIPPGVIEVVVRGGGTFVEGPGPVESASVELEAIGTADAILREGFTNTEGKLRFEDLPPGNFEIRGRKEGIGEALEIANLPVDCGLLVNLNLREPSGQKMFSKVRLKSGFAIRGNANYTGTLRQIRIRLAYAAWGGSRLFNPADFSLDDESMPITFNGVRENERRKLVVEPNLLQFTPITPDFLVTVQGFDVNRALYVDVRTLEGVNSDGDEE